MADRVHSNEAAGDEVLFDSGSVRVTTRHVVVRGRSWGLEHVCGVTAVLQPPVDRLMRAHAVFAGALLLVYGLVRAGSLGLSVAALVGYAALAWRVLGSESAFVWLHTRFSSQLVYRGRSSATARALAYALSRARQQREADTSRE